MIWKIFLSLSNMSEPCQALPGVAHLKPLGALFHIQLSKSICVAASLTRTED